MQNYELYIIFDQTTDDETCQSTINEFLSSVSAQNINIEREGLKKFSYPINKKLTGLYYLVKFDVELENTPNLNKSLVKFNKKEYILRYICINETDFLKQKSKEKLNPSPEFTNHREINKSKNAKKQCIIKYLGYRELDYKNTEFLNQFTSPYAKMFKRAKTGVSTKYQRKVSQAIKRARHMGLMPFTSKWIDN
jgi:small subunit ribosomal protein S18